MVEIALSLAIIGFALIAIIGVLPAGMTVQRDNREQTVINLDAAFLMDAIRNGAQGQNDLTNYILSITNISTPYSPSGVQTGASIPVSYGPAQLTNGAIIEWVCSPRPNTMSPTMSPTRARASSATPSPLVSARSTGRLWTKAPPDRAGFLF